MQLQKPCILAPLVRAAQRRLQSESSVSALFREFLGRSSLHVMCRLPLASHAVLAFCDLLSRREGNQLAILDTVFALVCAHVSVTGAGATRHIRTVQTAQ